MANILHLLDFPVLEKIFVELVHSGNFEDLKTARLVTNAPKWQAKLQKVWRREAVLVLREDPLFTPRSPGPGIELHLFNVELQNPYSFYNLQAIPYQRLKLRNVTIHLPYLKGKEGDNTPATQFWDVVGPNVKHLTLTNVTFIVDFFRAGRGYYWWRKNQDWVKFLRDKLPNLQTLVMDGMECRKSIEFEDDRFMSLESISSNSSLEATSPDAFTLPTVSVLRCDGGNLANLKLWNFPNLQEIRLQKAWHLRSLLKCVKGKPIDNIKRLFLQDTNFSYLSERGFPDLEYLHIEISNAYQTETEVANTALFVNDHGTKLTKLEAMYWLGSLATVNPIMKPFPVLTELHLWGNVIKDLSFLRFTPNLQKLNVDVHGFEKQTEMKAELKKHQDDLSLQTSHELITRAWKKGIMLGVQLAKLQYCQIYCQLSAKDVRTLGEWMPNLKTFKAVLGSQGFRGACVQWENLEELGCLFGSSITDTDIIFADLKNLKVFSYLAECGESTLSDVCVTDGFLKLTNLTTLHISVSPEFSKTAEEVLRDRVYQVKIWRCHGGGVQNDETVSDCCRNLEYKKFIFDFTPMTPSNLSMEDVNSWEDAESDLEEDEDINSEDSEEEEESDSEEDVDDSGDEDKKTKSKKLSCLDCCAMC